jgi:hypothetical protein
MKWKYEKYPWTRKVLAEITKTLDSRAFSRYHTLSLPRALIAEEYRAREPEIRAAKERKETRRALRSLQGKKYLKLKRQGTQLYFQLTEKGAEEILKQRIVESKARLPKGQLCYVSFDIPKRDEHVRRALKSLLFRAKFTMTHQSLWVTNRNVAGDLAALIRGMKAEDLVHVLVGAPKTRVPDVRVAVKS